MNAQVVFLGVVVFLGTALGASPARRPTYVGSVRGELQTEQTVLIEIDSVANQTTALTFEARSKCSNNCSSHGKCVQDPSNGDYSCLCDKGFGRSNSQAPQDCSEFTLALCPQLCFGHGVCVSESEVEAHCSCLDGFTGTVCSRWNRCKHLNYCSGHGACTRPSPFHDTQPAKCVCDPGFTGERCNIKLSGCPNRCSGHGICRVRDDVTSCVCDVGFGGPDCGVVITPLCPHSCSGLGHCDHDTLNCTCKESSGVDCSRAVSSCGNCHHGFCHESRCQCHSGFSGETCEIASPDPSCAAKHFCSGSGMCITAPGVPARCMCFEGFSGGDCSVIDVNYENLCPNHCSGNGRCQVGPQGLHCVCQQGWSASDCSVSGCPLGAGKVCSNHGVCEETSGVFACTCDKGFAGANCSVSLTARTTIFTEQPATTTTDSDAAPVDKPSVVRTTKPQLLQASSCVNSCSHRGACISGVCECNQGYEGDDCSREQPSLYGNDELVLDNLDLLELSHSMSQLWD